MNDNDQAGLDDAFGEDWDGTLEPAAPGDSIMGDTPATEPGTDTPPWVMARYDGECSGCFGPLMEGITEIRADGSGGWEGRCCE